MKCEVKDKYTKMQISLNRMRHIMSIWLKERGLTDELVDLLREDIKERESWKDEEIKRLRCIIDRQENDIKFMRGVISKKGSLVNDMIATRTDPVILYTETETEKKGGIWL